jgi:hypothetical protein
MTHVALLAFEIWGTLMPRIIHSQRIFEVTMRHREPVHHQPL